MSAELAARAAMLAALSGDAALAALVNQISDGEPLKASAPWLLIGDAVSTGWGARGVDGVTLRQPIQLVLRGDDLTAVTAILDRIDAALRGITNAAGAWRITSLRFERSRISRNRAEWRATMDYALRLVRLV
jgi:hypothetical protein